MVIKGWIWSGIILRWWSSAAVAHMFHGLMTSVLRDILVIIGYLSYRCLPNSLERHSTQRTAAHWILSLFQNIFCKC